MRSNYKGVVITVLALMFSAVAVGCQPGDYYSQPASTKEAAGSSEGIENSEPDRAVPSEDMEDPQAAEVESEQPEGSVSASDMEASEESDDNGADAGGDVEGASNTEDSGSVEEEPQQEEPQPTPPPKKQVDLIFFMGQSNMSGCGGNAALAPAVNEGAGYEFRAVSDPTKLYPITEPFGVYENYLGAIMEVPGEKKGSLVSSFVNEYYAQTNVSVVAVSASKGATSTRDWISQPYMDDVINRYKTAIDYLNANDYEIRKRYIVWLQGESDADKGIGRDEHKTNMDTIIRPFFEAGLDKVFIITPGRTLSRKDFFRDIIEAQMEMCRESDYYSLATNVLSGISTECMTDEWHYNQNALNKAGIEAAKSLAYYSNTGKEMCIYDYLHECTYIPAGYDYPADTVVEREDLSSISTTR